jgi:hypothetical protein
MKANARSFLPLFSSSMTLLVLGVACATSSSQGPFKPEPPMRAEVTVTSLRAEEQEDLERAICSIPGVSECRKRGGGREVLFTLTYNGSLGALRDRIDAIEHPGLEVEEVKASLRFRGFDNKPPTLTVLSPKDGATLVDPNVEVVVEATDKDTASVKVADKNAPRQRPGIYVARLKLEEGEHALPVTATDEAGNEAKVTLRITVDSTPPDLEATVKVVVEGKTERGSTVFVDGVPVPVDVFGGWRVEIPVRKGQRNIEIVAIDKNGNKTTETRSIGID